MAKSDDKELLRYERIMWHDYKTKVDGESDDLSDIVSTHQLSSDEAAIVQGFFRRVDDIYVLDSQFALEYGPLIKRASLAAGVVGAAAAGLCAHYSGESYIPTAITAVVGGIAAVYTEYVARIYSSIAGVPAEWCYGCGFGSIMHELVSSEQRLRFVNGADISWANLRSENKIENKSL